MKPEWILDKSGAPIVLLHIAHGSPNELPPTDGLFDAADSMLALGSRVVVVCDLTHARPDAHRRELVLKWIRDHMSAIRLQVAACAVVAPNAFLRGVFVATSWMVRAPLPVEAFGTRDAAERWAREQALRAGLLRG